VSESRSRWLVAAILGGVAALVVAIGTGPPGPGLDPDAQSYVGAAASLVRLGSYRVPTSGWAAMDTTEPLTHFPPGLSTAIAAPMLLGVPALQAGRLILVVAAFVTWAGLVAFLARVAGLPTAVGVGAAALCTPALVNVHLSILSEPPFLSALVGVLAGMWAMSRSRRSSATLWTGLACGVSVMLRYAGFSLTLAAAGWALMGPGRREEAVWPRVRRAALVAAPSILMVAMWEAPTASASSAPTAISARPCGMGSPPS